MRSLFGPGLLCFVAAFAAGRVTGQTIIDSTAVSGLSTCVLQCASIVSAQNNCQPTQSCFCDNTVVQDVWTECLITRCSFPDQLQASRFRAETCDAPRRDRSQLLSIVTYVLFGIAGLCLLARLASRALPLGGPGYGWDDFMAVLCFAPLIGLTVSIYFSVKYGEGQDIWTLGVKSVANFHMWHYIASVMYVFVIFGTKIALALFYLRTWGDKPVFRAICWTTLALLGAALVAFEVAVIAQCRPIASQWTRFANSDSQAQCVDRQTLSWALAGTDIGLNVLLILLPVRHIAKLNLTWAMRVGVCFLLLVGVAVLAMSIARVVYISEFPNTINTTYYYSFAGLYGSIEAYLSQVVCVLPGTQQLWRAATNSFRPLASNKSSRETMRISAPLQVPERHDFATIHTPRDAPDLEKAEHKESEEVNYASDDESAPPPVVQRSSHNSYALKHNSSFEPIIERIEPHRSTYRSSATTAPATRSSAITSTRNLSYRASSNAMREPDILYHDHQNRLRLEIHDPPDEPITAQLQYVDKNEGIHDLELQGRPREASSRPNTAPSQTYSTTNNSDSSISTESSSAGASIPPLNPRLSLLQSPSLLPWSQDPKDRPTMQADDRSKSEEEKLADLANARQILTEEGMSSSHTLSDI